MQRPTNLATALLPGEIIETAPRFGLIPGGVFRVEGVENGMVMLRCGEICTACLEQFLVIKRRRLPEPTSWLDEEIEVMKQQVALCDCEDCREELAKKERKRERQREKELKRKDAARAGLVQ